MDLIGHIEKYLGKIQGGEAISHEEYGRLNFGYFKNQPFDDLLTYITLGLSHHVISINENKDVRCELLFSVMEMYEHDNIYNLLRYVANEILSTHKALLRGQTLILPPGILKDCNMNGLYVSLPIFFDEDFHVYNSSPPTVFCWIFPLYSEEMDFIAHNGWNRFEDILEVIDCNLWDLKRPKINFLSFKE